jgi:hypothetical protein
MTHRTLSALILGLVLAFSSAAAHAEAKIPTTPEEHFALAKKYQDEADAAKKQADEHRAMADAAKQSIASSHAAAHGQKDPNVEKMLKHCAALAAAADKLASEAQKAADFHNLRGKELQGK